ncbi:MAG: hypothetical protein WCQ16_01010 [Verrucomicrobiae bacterium]
MASKRFKQKKKKLVPIKPDADRNSSPPQIAEPRVRTLAWIGFSAVLLACIAWVAAHAFLVDAVTVRLCNEADKNIPAEKRMPVFLSEIAFDGYAWNRHAEHLGENGEWRVRHTDFDNAPKGRELHWSSGLIWYLRGLGEIYRAATGDSLRNSIYRMSIWANPILLVLAIGLFSTLSARRFGPLCGAVIAIGMVAVPTFYEGFMPAYPDHHGLVAFTILGMLFGIAWAGAGWVQPAEGTDFAPSHSLKQAKHGMIFSGICGAAGLWISAFSIVMVALGIGVAAIVSVVAFSGSKRRKTRGDEFHPEVWKVWGFSAALGSLFFYALEYFPSNMGMRLEVNHPLYALAWLGGGWGIYAFSRWFARPDRRLNNFPWTELVLCVLAGAILPGFILLGGSQSPYYLPLDPFQKQLATNVAEGLPLLTRIKLGGLTWQMAFGWFPVFLLLAFALQFSRKTGSGTKAVLLFLSIPILFITALQFHQVRWGMLAGPLYIALAGIVIPQVWKLIPREALSRVLAMAIFLSFGYLFVEPSLRNCFQTAWAQFRSGDKVSITAGQGLALLHRQMARAILDDAAGKPVVLLSSPNSSCLLSALGGFKSIGTLYWENGEGLKAAAAGLNSQSDEEALAFIKKHGITHVSLMTWENFIGPYFGILYPKGAPGKSYEKSFGKRALFDKVIPFWTRPLIFPPNDLTKGLAQQVLLLQVVPEQTLAEAKFHLARFARLVEGNPITAEITLKEILDNAPGSSLVRMELADLYLSQGRHREAADQTLAAMKDLPPDLRKSLAGQLAEKFIAAGKPDLAAEMLKAGEEPAKPN